MAAPVLNYRAGSGRTLRRRYLFLSALNLAVIVPWMVLAGFEYFRYPEFNREYLNMDRLFFCYINAGPAVSYAVLVIAAVDIVDLIVAFIRGQIRRYLFAIYLTCAIAPPLAFLGLISSLSKAWE